MKLKYFLRGVGIGVVVTTLILTISHGMNSRMSDAQVIERARALGMSFAGTNDGGASIEFDTSEKTSETQKENTESTAESKEPEVNSSEAETQSAEGTSAEENSKVSEATTKAEETTKAEATTKAEETTKAETTTKAEETTKAETTTKAPETTKAEATTKAPETTEAAGGVVTYRLVISSGMSSNMVARQLQENGIIKDAVDFNNFLEGNGYADRIAVGEFEVNSSMNYETLANSFSRR